MRAFERSAERLREIHRVLADSGRVAIAVGGSDPPVFEILAQALARHVPMRSDSTAMLC